MIINFGMVMIPVHMEMVMVTMMFQIQRLIVKYAKLVDIKKRLVN